MTMTNHELSQIMTINDKVFSPRSLPAWARERVEHGTPGQWVRLTGTIYARCTADPLDPGNMVEMGCTMRGFVVGPAYLEGAPWE